MASGFPSKYMSTSEQFPIIVHGWLLIHKDGRCERLLGNDIIPAGTDLITGVQCKDILISLETNLFVRVYIPKTTDTNRKFKLPVLIYYHGGAFVSESAYSSTYQPTLNLITNESKVIVVSVNYRLAPEYPIPIPYEDSWEAIKWVASHGTRNGPESWLNDHADFQNVFFAGDSAGANIAHNMAIQISLNPVNGIKLKGVILLHPYFGGKDPTQAEAGEYHQFTDHMWKMASPSSSGLDDPLFNPEMDSRLSGFGCSKILLCVGEKDKLRFRGWNYKKVMEKSGWKGRVEVMESKGERHLFFLLNTSSENARMLRKRICMFINPIPSKK